MRHCRTHASTRPSGTGFRLNRLPAINCRPIIHRPSGTRRMSEVAIRRSAIRRYTIRRSAIRRSAVRRSAVRRSAIRRSAIRRSRNTPIRSTPMRSTPMRSTDEAVRATEAYGDRNTREAATRGPTRPFAHSRSPRRRSTPITQYADTQYADYAGRRYAIRTSPSALRKRTATAIREKPRLEDPRVPLPIRVRPGGAGDNRPAIYCRYITFEEDPSRRAGLRSAYTQCVVMLYTH